MKFAAKFSVSPNWLLLLNDIGASPSDVLRFGQLPADLFSRAGATLSPGEYYRLWIGIEKALSGQELPLLLAEHLSVEVFDAPIFASICSDNLAMALGRLQRYKPLIGPVQITLKTSSTVTELSLSYYGNKGVLPKTLCLAECVFFTQLARLATRAHVCPLAITLPELPDDIDAYQDYFGCKLQQGEQVKVQFSTEDAQRPFLTANVAMWQFFEDKLNCKLADLDQSAQTSERVRAVLLEALPSGTADIDSVASKLAMSPRTLQRKLNAEQQNFKGLLQTIRTELADYYLLKSELSLSEISFLLGFNEPNSFIRAYTNWTGLSPGSVRLEY